MLPSEAKDLISIIASGGKKAPPAFGKLIQALLSNTVLADYEKVRCIFSDQEKHWVLESRKIGLPVKLHNGRYLYLRYDLDLTDDKLSVIKSTIQYQKNQSKPYGEIFRYDFERQPANQDLPYENRKNLVPESHCHVYLNTPDDKTPETADLDRLHFVCGRVSIEAIIRMLVRDFMIKPKVEDVGWLDLLDTTEQAFKHRYDPALVRG